MKTQITIIVAIAVAGIFALGCGEFTNTDVEELLSGSDEMGSSEFLDADYEEFGMILSLKPDKPGKPDKPTGRTCDCWECIDNLNCEECWADPDLACMVSVECPAKGGKYVVCTGCSYECVPKPEGY